MLTKRKDKDGKIIGYIEWVRLTKKNIPDNNGQFVYIRYMWVHEDSRHTGLGDDMFIEMCEETKNSPYVYWQKHKCKDKVETFTKKQFLDKVKKRKQRSQHV